MGIERPAAMVNVLVMEGDRLIRELLGELLASAGYRVTVATNGTEGLRRFADGPFHVVVTDCAHARARWVGSRAAAPRRDQREIEGFFDACQRHGLTGSQGVLIPEANVGHLMLRDDVAAAVRDERFHLHAARSTDDGLAVLSGREAGELRPDGRYPEGSFNEAVRQALVRNVEQLKALRAAPGPGKPG